MSTFTLKFFARLKEEMGTSELVISLGDVSCLSELKDYLIERNPSWKSSLEKNLLSAVNQTMVTADVALKDGDEVAMFPPVTGG